MLSVAHLAKKNRVSPPISSLTESIRYSRSPHCITTVSPSRQQYPTARNSFRLCRRLNPARNAAEATGDGNEFDKIGTLHLDPNKPDFRVDRFKTIPEGLIAIEIDGATARRLFGKTLSIHHYNHTLQHTVGAANAKSYWFKLNLAPAEDDAQYAQEAN